MSTSNATMPVPENCRPQRLGREKASSSRTSAFTLTELLTVIAIIGVLAAIVIPVVGKMRDSARASQCSSNLRQVFNLYMIDVQENRGMTPPDRDPVTNKSIVWIDRIAAKYFSAAESKGIAQALGCPIQIQLKDPELIESSFKNKRAPRTYSINRDLTRSLAAPYVSTTRAIVAIPFPSRTVLAGDGNDSDRSPSYYTGVIGTGRPPEAPHNDKANIVFLDGHLEAIGDQSLLNVPGVPKAGTPQAMFWFGE